MIIRYEYDDILGYAPHHCDAAIVWRRLGLNVSRQTWTAFVEKIGERRVARVCWAPAESVPWAAHTAHSSPLSIDPPLGRLRFLYQIANESGAEGGDDKFVQTTLKKALDELGAKRGVQTVAYLGVPPLRAPGQIGMGEASVLARVDLIADEIRRWGSEHPRSSIREVVLVSNSEKLRAWMGCARAVL